MFSQTQGIKHYGHTKSLITLHFCVMGEHMQILLFTVTILRKTAKCIKEMTFSWLSVSSCPDPHPESRESCRMVEVHSQHHLCLQARGESDKAWWPDPLDTLQGHCLQVSQGQVYEEIFVTGPWWELSRSEWPCSRQKQPCDTMEGHMGQASEKVPATRKEGEMQESLEGGSDKERLHILSCPSQSRWGGIRDTGKKLTLQFICNWVGRTSEELITCELCPFWPS